MSCYRGLLAAAGRRSYHATCSLPRLRFLLTSTPRVLPRERVSVASSSFPLSPSRSFLLIRNPQTPFLHRFNTTCRPRLLLPSQRHRTSGAGRGARSSASRASTARGTKAPAGGQRSFDIGALLG